MNKQDESNEIQSQIDAYLACGGEITHLPYLCPSNFSDFNNFASMNEEAFQEYKARGHIKNGKKTTEKPKHGKTRVKKWTISSESQSYYANKGDKEQWVKVVRKDLRK